MEKWKSGRVVSSDHQSSQFPQQNPRQFIPCPSLIVIDTMGCNRTPTEKEAQVIQQAAARVVSEVGGVSSARAEHLVSMYGEYRAKVILREEQQAQQQAWNNSWSYQQQSNVSSVSSVASSNVPYAFEQPAWASSSSWNSSWAPNDPYTAGSTPSSSPQPFWSQNSEPHSPQTTSATSSSSSPQLSERSSSNPATTNSLQPSAPELTAAPPGTPQSVTIDRGVSFSEIEITRTDVPPDKRAFEQNQLIFGTDPYSRPVSAQGWLGEGVGGQRTSEEKQFQRSAANYQTGLDGTHLLARMFGIPNVPENLIAFPAEVNRDKMRHFETSLEKRIKSGERLFAQAFASYQSPMEMIPYMVMIVVYDDNAREIEREIFTPDGYAH